MPIMAEALKLLKSKPRAELIWASPRELLNIFQADAIGCHIITATNDILKKLSLVGKDLDRYSLETSRDRFYAGGDLITGASNVSNAMGIGKKAARNIDKRLTGQERFPSLIPDFAYEMVPPETPSESARHVPGEMPAAQRVQSYAEVSLGLTAAAAMEETARCLRCDVRSVER